jgi:hypothetical protein
MISGMSRIDSDDLVRRRTIEDELLTLGGERERLAYQDSWNRQRMRGLLGPAREAGITIRDTARLTGLSTQTLHTWMRDLMRPIPEIHFGRVGPPPQSLEQSVLRTMGEDPQRDWEPTEIRKRIPDGWPTGPVEGVRDAMERLARGHMIWDGDAGYRVTPPDA